MRGFSLCIESNTHCCHLIQDELTNLFPILPCNSPWHNLLCPPTLQEDESPDSGELRRVESSPAPLKRDRSFSEHDLALLRGETLSSLAESVQHNRVVRLNDERHRSRTLTGFRPMPNYRGQSVNVH